MYAALVALRDPAQNKLLKTTLQEVTDARTAVNAPLAAIDKASTDDESRALLARIRRDLATYDAFSAKMQLFAKSGDVIGVRPMVRRPRREAERQTLNWCSLHARFCRFGIWATAGAEDLLDTPHRLILSGPFAARKPLRGARCVLASKGRFWDDYNVHHSPALVLSNPVRLGHPQASSMTDGG